MRQGINANDLKGYTLMARFLFAAFFALASITFAIGACAVIEAAPGLQQETGVAIVGFMLFGMSFCAAIVSLFVASSKA